MKHSSYLISNQMLQIYFNVFSVLCLIVLLNKLITFFFKVQQGRTGNSEKETALPSTKAEFTSPPSLFKTGLPPSRLVREL